MEDITEKKREILDTYNELDLKMNKIWGILGIFASSKIDDIRQDEFSSAMYGLQDDVSQIRNKMGELLK